MTALEPLEPETLAQWVIRRLTPEQFREFGRLASQQARRRPARRLAAARRAA